MWLNSHRNHNNWRPNQLFLILFSSSFLLFHSTRAHGLRDGQLHNPEESEPDEQDLPRHLQKQRSILIERLPSKVAEDIDYFDKLDVNKLFQNKKFVNFQINCLIYGGVCDYFGSKAKALLPSVILDNCRLCTPAQKNRLSQVVVHLQQKYPGAWRDALIKYGGAPKFITAGQAAPFVNLFGNAGKNKEKYHYSKKNNQNYNPVLPIPLADEEVNGDAMGQLMDSLIMLPTTGVSANPDPEPVLDIPTTPSVSEPTTSTDRFFQIASSSQSPSTSATLESTIQVKPTTIEP